MVRIYRASILAQQKGTIDIFVDIAVWKEKNQTGKACWLSAIPAKIHDNNYVIAKDAWHLAERNVYIRTYFRISVNIRITVFISYLKMWIYTQTVLASSHRYFVPCK